VSTKTLGQVGYEAYSTRTGGKSLASGEMLPPWSGLPAEIREAWEIAGEAIAQHARASLYAELGNDHYVHFTEDGWTTEHSVECRLSGHMHECEYHTAVSRVAGEYDPDRVGRWKITSLDSEGLPSLERA
jgi:hypothetical protein